MAENLESIVGNFVRGTVTGVVTIADPVGTIISSGDYWITGAGPSDKERALAVFRNHTYQKFYQLLL